MNYVEKLLERIPALTACGEEIEGAVTLITETAESGKILLAGNGGSEADCDHIAGELMKGFLLKREPYCDEEILTEALGTRERALLLQRGIPAVSLPSMSAPLTAFLNDVEPELVYAQLVYALGRRGDLFIGISTSGNSKSVLAAAQVARAIGMRVLALTGRSGGRLAACADIAIRVPEDETYLIQELHLPVYHALCAEAESRLFGGGEA